MAEYGYARVSTLDQDTGLQLAALKAAGIDQDRIYQEKVSGVAKSRPVRDEVLRRLQASDVLTVWKLDRLGRSVTELLDIIRDLEQRGVRFRCVTQPIDTTTPAGRMFLTFLAAFAEFEREMIRERSQAGKALRAAAGKHPGGPRRYGFEPDHETVREAEAEVLRAAADALLDGAYLNRVVAALNDCGHPAPNGGHWQVTTLRTMLKNPRVVPILGQERYDRLTALFGPRETRRRGGRPAAHLLSGILHCSCGQAMYALPAKRRTTYYCRKVTWSGGRSTGCGRVYVSKPAADRWAAEAFVAAVASDTFAAALDQREAELLGGEVSAAELDDWRAEVEELETVLGTRFGTDDMRRQRDDLQRRVERATARLMAQPELQAMRDLPRAEDALRAAWERWTLQERRVWLRRVFERIVCKPATMRGRGSDVSKRLDPKWRL